MEIFGARRGLGEEEELENCRSGGRKGKSVRVKILDEEGKRSARDWEGQLGGLRLVNFISKPFPATREDQLARFDDALHADEGEVDEGGISEELEHDEGFGSRRGNGGPSDDAEWGKRHGCD